jgi:hypothetical protein
LSRIYQDERFAETDQRPVDVTIRRGSTALEQRLAGSGIEALVGAGVEQLEWWDADRDGELRGWVHEAVLIQSVTERNAVVEARAATLSTEPRQLTEDMVLVQELASSRAWDQAFADQNRSTDLINLDRLAAEPDSRWLDWTQPARQAAKLLYRRVLGENAERGEGTYAAKR